MENKKFELNEELLDGVTGGTDSTLVHPREYEGLRQWPEGDQSIFYPNNTETE